MSGYGIPMTTQIGQQERKPIYGHHNGGTEIIFDSRKSKSGKSIPIDAPSGLLHQCKYSNFAKQQQQQKEVTPKEEVKREPTITELLNEILYNIHQLQKEIQELRK
jgi:hypothetical protein